MRAYLYTRSAMYDIAKEEEIKQRLIQMRAYANQRSFLVVGESYDLGIGGRSASRPGLNTVMAAATSKLRAFDVLVLHSMKCLARDHLLFGELMRKLKAAGVVKVVTSTSPHLDSDVTPVSIEEIQASLDQYGSRLNEH
jgi:hypothetical protein